MTTPIGRGFRFVIKGKPTSRQGFSPRLRLKLVGPRSVPDFEPVDGRKVGSLLRVGKGLLLDFDPYASLQALTSRWRESVTYVASDATNRLGLRAVLVRPDGFAAWASETAADDAKTAHALSR